MHSLRQYSRARPLPDDAASRWRRKGSGGLIEALQISGLIFAAVALCDRRAWPCLMIVLTVWGATEISETNPERMIGLAHRVFIDILGAVIAFALVRKTALGKGVIAIFVIMLMNHGMFWLSVAVGVNLWLPYAHGLNVLWLLQMMFVSLPGSLALVGFVSLGISMALHMVRTRNFDPVRLEIQAAERRFRSGGRRGSVAEHVARSDSGIYIAEPSAHKVAGA